MTRVYEAFVRTFLQYLLGMEDRTGRLPPPPTEAEYTDGPTLGQFAIAWDRDLRCYYNVEAARLFTEAFLDSENGYRHVLPDVTSLDGRPERDPKAIRKAVKTAFWIHINYLQGRYKLQTHPQADSLIAMARAADRKRKRRIRVSAHHHNEIFS